MSLPCDGRHKRGPAGAEKEPNEKYRSAHVWYDADEKMGETPWNE